MLTIMELFTDSHEVFIASYALVLFLLTVLIEFACIRNDDCRVCMGKGCGNRLNTWKTFLNYEKVSTPLASEQNYLT